MYNFDPYNVLLSIATNIPVLLMTAFVLQGHIWFKHAKSWSHDRSVRREALMMKGMKALKSLEADAVPHLTCPD